MTDPHRRWQEHSRDREGSLEFSTKADVWTLAGVVVLYAAMIVLTRPLDLGDTVFYVDPILAMSQHPSVAALRPLLDFGHLLWRPLGWAVYEGLRVLTPITTPDSARIAVTRALIGVDMVAGAVASGLLYLMCRQLKFNQIASVLTCATFIGSNAVINTAHAGSSYMLALALLMGALWLVLRSPSASGPVSLGAGVLLALSAAVWFPFVLVAPAVLLASMATLSNGPQVRARGSIPRSTVRLAGSSLATGLIVFGVAALVLNIRDVGQLREWVQASAHGWRQRSALLRLGLGLPRCCLALGDVGLLWKRYILGDPFAHVARTDLVRGSITSVALMAVFYLELAALVYTLARRPAMGRAILMVLVSAAVPMLIFAVFLFEPSSIERFMPVFPFFFLAIGYQLDVARHDTKMRSIALLFSASVLVSTFGSYRNAAVERYWAPATTRLTALSQHVAPASTIAVLSHQDVIDLYAIDNPLGEAVSTHFELSPVLRPANQSIFCWRELFAKHVLAAWNASREVWISQRLLAAVPLPDWGWAEGEDPAIRWRSIPEFFRGFQFDATIGGQDGFVRLPSTPMNRAQLQKVSGDSCAS